MPNSGGRRSSHEQKPKCSSRAFSSSSPSCERPLMPFRLFAEMSTYETTATRIYINTYLCAFCWGFFPCPLSFFSICLAFCVLIVLIFNFSFFPLFCFLFVLFFHVFFVLFCCLFHSSHLSFQFSFPLSPWSSGAVQTVTQFAAFVSCGAGRPTRTLSPDGNPAVFFILRTKPLFYFIFLFFFVRPVCFTVPVRLSDENYLVIDVLTFWHGPEF